MVLKGRAGEVQKKREENESDSRIRMMHRPEEKQHLLLFLAARFPFYTIMFIEYLREYFCKKYIAIGRAAVIFFFMGG